MKQTPVLRVLSEGIVIVVSILLAFGIDAWWGQRQAREAERQQLSVLRAEMIESRSELEYRLTRGASSLEAQRVLMALIRPDPEPIPTDSLAGLLERAWAYGIAEVESGALDALLGSGDFRASARPDLYRLLVRYRVVLSDHRIEDREQFVELRTRLLDYVGSVAPGAFVIHGTDFPVPVSDLLGDQRLEGVVSQISLRTSQMDRHVAQLFSLADSIIGALDREGPS